MPEKPQVKTKPTAGIADAPGAWLSDLQFLRWLEKWAPETMRAWRENYARSVADATTESAKAATVSQARGASG